MNSVLQQILTTGFVEAQDGTRHLVHSSIPVEEGRYLQGLIRDRRPSVSLEIGCAFGVSSLFICEAMREVGGKQHIIIDPFQNDPAHPWGGIGSANLARAGYGTMVELREALSFECLPRLKSEGLRIDFVFIDGQHTFDYVLVDFFLVDKLLNVGGIVVLDDYTYPSIRKVCRYIAANLPYRCIGPQTTFSAPWRSRLISKFAASIPFSHWSKPELKSPERNLRLPPFGRYVAFEKLAEDSIGDAADCNRRWDTHFEF
jgi:predicted O-methyltransferase YrrM